MAHNGKIIQMSNQTTERNNWKGRGSHWLLCLLLLFTTPQLLAVEKGNSTSPLEPIRLQLKWLHQFQFAGYYAAIEQGYYRQLGLEVSLLEHPLKRSPLDVLLAGDADYVVMGSDLLVARSEGNPLVALAAITQHDPLALLVTKSSGITHPKELRGKRVMLDHGAHDASILAMLKQAGLTEEDYQFQQTSYNPQDLAEGKTDAFNAYITDQGFLLDEQGIENHYLHPSRYGIDFYSDILATTEMEIAQHPQRVENFRKASLKGWAYAMANSDEIINLILQKYNSQNRSRAHLEYEAAQMREMVQPLLVQLGYMHRDRWLHIRDTFNSLGFLKQELGDIDALFYQQESSNNDQELKQILWTAFAAVLVLSTITLLITLWNRKLKQQVALRTNELASANEHIERILESMNEGLVVTDAAHHILRINRKLERLIGNDSEHCIGRPLVELFEESQDHSILDAQRTLKGEDDTLIPVQVSGALLQHENSSTIDGAVLVIHDLRERERAERQEQYAAFQAGVADMGASVLHNIGNVITGMSGHIIKLDHTFKILNKLSSSLAKYLEELPDNTSYTLQESREQLEKQQRILQASATTLEKMCNTIDEKESLKKLNQGIHHVGDVIAIQQSASRPIIHATHFSFRSMMEDTVNLIEDRMDKYGIAFKVENSPELQELFLPRNPLMQLFLNLIKNSLEAIIEEMLNNEALSGAIQLTAEPYSEGQFKIVVEDNGCGFEAERIDEIFQSGYTTKQRGSGYGLHSATTFVQSIGGEIQAESRGKHYGMRITLILPTHVDNSNKQ